ncbi:MAG: class I SAM-dependent DNA methyltransferase [Hyphomicrobiales bacterium]
MNDKKRFLKEAYKLEGGEDVRELYDDWAKVYDTELMSENEYQQPARCTAALLDFVKQGAGAIFDAGCGTGLAGEGLANAGYGPIDGCDFSQGMLDKAKARNIYRTLFTADLNQPLTQIEDCAYAGVAVVGVFSYGHVDADAVDELLRITAPGGAVVIGINDKYYAEGSLIAKLRDVDASGAARLAHEEHGDHIPGIGMGGWVFVVRKSAA